MSIHCLNLLDAFNRESWYVTIVRFVTLINDLNLELNLRAYHIPIIHKLYNSCKAALSVERSNWFSTLSEPARFDLVFLSELSLVDYTEDIQQFSGKVKLDIKKLFLWEMAVVPARCRNIENHCCELPIMVIISLGYRSRFAIVLFSCEWKLRA